ncbi:hypothetical protein IM797_19955 [Pedobacter sp. MC2016-24]|nr:hypothetical protein [Pedobacter sp. MC2016-24]
MVSHELKTPLTSLNGYIQMLQRKSQQTQDNFTSNALDTAAKQVQKMTTMINGFLNRSRLESGKIILHNTNFDIHEVIAATIEQTRQLESSHQINFLVSAPVNVYADRDKIANVISNFLSNAIKDAQTIGLSKSAVRSLTNQ